MPSHSEPSSAGTSLAQQASKQTAAGASKQAAGSGSGRSSKASKRQSKATQGKIANSAAGVRCLLICFQTDFMLQLNECGVCWTLKVILICATQFAGWKGIHLNQSGCVAITWSGSSIRLRQIIGLCSDAGGKGASGQQTASGTAAGGAGGSDEDLDRMPSWSEVFSWQVCKCTRID